MTDIRTRIVLLVLLAAALGLTIFAVTVTAVSPEAGLSDGGLAHREAGWSWNDPHQARS